MKKLFTLLAVVATTSSTLWSQAPGFINYQAVARDGTGALMVSQSINVTFMIRSGSAVGPIVYEEDHAGTMTNQFGMFSLMIGSGTIVSGTMNGIDWANNPNWLEVEVNGASIGTQQMVSVPYALHAGGPWKKTGNDVYYNDGNVGIGTASPSGPIHVVSASPYIGAFEGSSQAYFQIWEGGAAKAYMGSYSGAANDADFGTVSGSSASTHLVTSATPRLTVDATGRVGIGTTAPNNTLHVVSPSGFAATFDGAAGMYVAINEAGTYRGYWGSFSGAATDVDFGTGGSNATGKVHLVLQAAPALTVAPGGFVGIGTTTPNDPLDVVGNVDVTGRVSFGSVEYLEDGGSNTITSQASIVPAVDNVRALGTSALRWTDVWAVDGTINTSDAREKTSIEDLTYGLKELLAMRPVTYRWIAHPEQGQKIGLIAQEVQTVLPEAVRDWEWSTSEETGEATRVASQRLGIMYDDILPVAIKAIQEQQAQIEALKAEIEALKAVIRN